MVEELCSADFDLDSLGLNFNTTGFGPANTEFGFKDQFDGKLFKPYSKRDRLGRLFDFAQVQMQQQQQTNFVAPRQTIAQQHKQARAVAESGLVTAAADSEFNVVEEKKGGDREEGVYRRREKQTMGQGVHKQKLNARLEEEKASAKVTMQGPQQTKKRAEWFKKTQRARDAGNT